FVCFLLRNKVSTCVCPKWEGHAEGRKTYDIRRKTYAAGVFPLKMPPCHPDAVGTYARRASIMVILPPCQPERSEGPMSKTSLPITMSPCHCELTRRMK